MKKTLRIFANDTRHFWPEICLTLAITAVYALTASSGWPGFPHRLLPDRDAEYFGASLTIVLILVWYLVTARVVLEDPLAGDQQLWISRPVGWPALLAAKLLFLAAFILAPLCLAQMYILHVAGFNPLHFLPSFSNSMLETSFMLLPALALASISPSLKRLMLYAIGLVALTYVSNLAISAFHDSSQIHLAPAGFDWLGRIQSWIFEAGLAAIVLIQYTRRRTALAFVVFAAVFLASTAADIAEHHRSPLREYPALSASEQPLAQIAYNPDPKFQKPYPIVSDDKEIELRVPVTLSAIVPGRTVVADATSTTVEAPGLASITLPWTAYATMTNTDFVEVNVPGDFIRKAAGKPLTFRVTYALSELEPTSSTTLIAGGQTLNAPGNGHCYQYSGTDDAVCLYASSPFHGYNRVSWTDHTQCGVSSPGDLPREAWSSSFMPTQPSAFSDGHIWAVKRAFPVHTRQVDSDLYFCPTTPLTFTSFRVVRRRQMQVMLPPIDPSLYNVFHHSERD